MNYENILQNQRVFFYSQKTKDISFRIENLKKLKKVIQNNEKALYGAIYKDFGKSEIDTYLTEISIIINEMNYFIKHVKSLSKPKLKKTNLVNLPAISKLHPDPLGCTLVIGAWNYPYQLSILPLVTAMAAGNCCILKPSEVAPNTMDIMEKLINSNFPSEYIYVIKGGVEETTEILKLKFDKIFFTGSSKVGKIVYEAAAKHMAPVTLELGGKSPCIVTDSADLKVAAKRIVWGKFLNAGQTCIATDYILVSKNSKDQLLELLKSEILKAGYSSTSTAFTKIVNEKNFDRLTKMIDPQKVFHGGQFSKDELYIEPTILDKVTWDDEVMQDEIFGPILPVLPVENLHEALNIVLEYEKPLAAYLFSTKSQEKQLFTSKISFGGGCINDVLMHISNDNLPFGGVGNSGIGHYHGKYGFECFSHQKAVLEKPNWGEPPIKYPPYTDGKFNILKKLM